MTIPCRLIVDAPLSGAWNMAVDEALLDSTAASGVPALRFYRWAEPTLSLGCLQRYTDRSSHRASRDLAVVRRPSGGAAIIHDHDLTYSLSLPASHPLAKESRRFYFAAHEALAAALARHRVRAELASPPLAPEAFLCFERQSLGDLVVDGRKIGGSAQRRRRGAVLQHGSLLLATSTGAPELPGLAELAGLKAKPEELIEPCLAELAARFDLSCSESRLTAPEMEQTKAATLEKYGTLSWTQRR